MKIRVENIVKTFADADKSLTVIDGLSLEFPENGSIAIVGRSGVGKSTLLHLLGGIDTPTEGRIFYNDTDITRLGREELGRFRGMNIGFVFQFHHLLPDFTALENVAMPLIIQGCSDAYERAEVTLEQVGLKDRMKHLPGELSGGEQQRVAIARAVVMRPSVILADEPTGNLDVKNAEAVKSLLLALKDELNIVCIVATHSVRLAEGMDYVFEMIPGGALERKDNVEAV